MTGLGAAARLIAIGSVPPGLYQDEAFNGLDALRVLNGDHPLYFTANNGREPLLIYLASVAVAWLGRTPAAVRLPAALLGTLTIPTTYFLGHRLFNRRVGMLACALVAAAFWPLHLSRIAFRAVGLPLLMAAALAAGWHGARRSSRGWMLAAGLLYGLGFYTYLPSYVTLLALAAFALYLWIGGYRQPLRRAAPWFLLGAGLAVAPLAVYAADNPGLLFGRSAQVSILSPAVDGAGFWETLGRQIGRGLGMFFWRGDTIARHNLPSRPVFDPLVALFFLGGTWWAGMHWRRPAAFFALLWTTVMLLPTILAEDAPHFLRAVGVLPVVFLLPAVGLDRIGSWLATRGIGRRWVAALIALVPAASFAWTLVDYNRYATDPLTGYAFQSAAVELAGQIKNADAPVWASERFANEWESTLYLVGDKDVHWIPEEVVADSITLPATLFLWPYEPVKPQLAALPAGVRLEGWTGPLIQGDLDEQAYPLYWGYQLEQAAGLPDEFLAHFEGGIRLEAAAGVLNNLDLKVTLVWSPEEELESGYSVFVHLLDAGGILAQDDALPAEGTLPTDWWRPGDRVVDTHLLSLPAPYDAARQRLVVGLYEGMNRLPVLDATGQPAGDAVTLDPAVVSGK